MPPVPETVSPAPGESSEEIAIKFKKILRSNGIINEVSNVTIRDAGLTGEGLTSETHFVLVEFHDAALKPMNFFVKTATESPSHAEFLENTKLFQKESIFFSKYVPAVGKFCKDKGQEELVKIYPKCYYSDEKMIVLENLVVEHGFELLDKVEQQDIDATKLALTTLAHHHAISWAFIKKIGGPEILFKKFPTLDFEAFASDSVKDMIGPSMENAVRASLEILEKSHANGKEVAIDLLKEKVGNAWHYAVENLKVDSREEYLVLNHGDYWNNNMMFRRDKETNEFVDHIVLDMQAVRYDSPTSDLGYFMYSSVKPEVRRTHFKDLIMHYLNVLNETTEKLGSPICMTYDKLFQSYRRKFEFGFWFCGMTLCTKASYLARKQLDVSKTDIKDFGNALAQLTQKWIEDNPETCEEEAEWIVKLMKEYKHLKG